jgi:hypothetical protein
VKLTRGFGWSEEVCGGGSAVDRKEVRWWIAGDRDRPVLFIAQDEEDKREEESQK